MASCVRSRPMSVRSSSNEGIWPGGIIRGSITFRTGSRSACRTSGDAAPGPAIFTFVKMDLVHYCSQQRGYPGKALAEYTVADIRREFLTEKSCAPHCTVSCVHQVGYLDFWRAPQQPEQACPRGVAAAEQVQREPPAGKSDATAHPPAIGASHGGFGADQHASGCGMNPACGLKSGCGFGSGRLCNPGMSCAVWFVSKSPLLGTQETLFLRL